MMVELTTHIGAEQLRDRHQVRMGNEAAFERSDEADPVDRLREAGTILLSLVAELDPQIVGHIVFSRMAIDTALPFRCSEGRTSKPSAAWGGQSAGPAWPR